MRVEAFVADSAEAVQGKIYALGIGWDTIFAPGFPTTHPRMALCMIVHVGYTETSGTHTVSITLEDLDGALVQLGVAPDGTALSSVEGSFAVGRPPFLPAGDEQLVPFVFVFDQLTFQAPNTYSWVVKLDGDEKARLRLRVANQQ